MGELEGKVAVITGAGSGMGKASVKVFVREGALGVVAGDISGAQELTAKEVGEAVVPVHCDVSREEDVAAMIDLAVARFGRVDAVLNVAGIVHRKPMLEVSESEYNRVMDVMLRGVFLGTVYGVRAMMKTGGGAIVNWSSLAGLNSASGVNVYSAAKAGVIALTKSAAIEHGPDGVRVNAVCPGYILSEIMGQMILPKKDMVEAVIPLRHVGYPPNVAEVAAFLCSDRASFVNGAIIPVDGGQSALLA